MIKITLNETQINCIKQFGLQVAALAFDIPERTLRHHVVKLGIELPTKAVSNKNLSDLVKASI